MMLACLHLPLIASGLPNRTSLAYDEQAKTGSGALRQALPYAVVGCNDHWHKGDGRQHGPARKSHKPFCRGKITGCNESEACYVETGPRHGADATLAQSHYVMSSVREPCDWLVSMFSWSRRPDLAASKNVTSKNVTETKAEFASWVRAEKESALLYEFEKAHKVGQNAPHVDCWVRGQWWSI